MRRSGVQLPPLEAEEAGDDHALLVERVENELWVTMEHPMTKEHFISFLALVTSDRVQLVKLYPEQTCGARFTPPRPRHALRLLQPARASETAL